MLLGVIFGMRSTSSERAHAACASPRSRVARDRCVGAFGRTHEALRERAGAHSARPLGALQAVIRSECASTDGGVTFTWRAAPARLPPSRALRSRGFGVWRFDVYGDASGKHRWRLFADDGHNVASSGQPFAGRSQALHSASAFRRDAASAIYEVYESAAHGWRWRAKATDGRTIANSGETFAGRQDAERASGNVRDNAGGADTA
jgi:uncharacterized protein